jgi:hypothetical protein
MATSKTRKEVTMQVLANDQIGYTPQTCARADRAGAKTSNKSMHMPFTASVNSGAGGKINRQDLPNQALKIDEMGQGASSSGAGSYGGVEEIYNRYGSMDDYLKSADFQPEMANALEYRYRTRGKGAAPEGGWRTNFSDMNYAPGFSTGANSGVAWNSEDRLWNSWYVAQTKDEPNRTYGTLQVVA